jgi:hypothetical protein
MIRRLLPWLVLAAAIAAGASFVDPVLPIADHGLGGLWGLTKFITRITAVFGAIAGGAFALSWRPSRGDDSDTARRRGGLRVIGTASLASGIIGIASPFIGMRFGHSSGLITVAALLGGLSAWGTWQASRGDRHAAPLTELTGGDGDLEWFQEYRDRVRTPVP